MTMEATIVGGRRSIASQVRRMLVVVSGLALLTASGIYAGLEYRFYRDSLLDRVSVVAGVVATNSVAAVSFEDASTASRVLDALRNMLWRQLVPERGDPESAELSAAAPDSEAVCIMTLDGVEKAALYEDGLLAVFASGAAFVSFADIAAYTRVPVPGAGFHLHTQDGTHYELSDARMGELGGVLDFLYAR